MKPLLYCTVIIALFVFITGELREQSERNYQRNKALVILHARLKQCSEIRYEIFDELDALRETNFYLIHSQDKNLWRDVQAGRGSLEIYERD